MAKPASYSNEMKAKAQAQSAHMVTLDINGKFAKKGTATTQSLVVTEDELQRVWDFFEWLTMGRYRERAARESAATVAETATETPAVV